MSLPNVLYKTEGTVAKIVLNRPPMNILNLDAIRDLIESFKRANKDEAVHVIMLDAAGDKAFSAGADVREHLPEKVRELISTFHELAEKILGSPKPTIGVVRGYALGGGNELAMLCDFVVASKDSFFGQPEINLGVFPPVAVAFLPRLVGPRNALRMVLTGEPVSAEEAQKMGLVSAVAEREKLEEKVSQIVDWLRSKSPVALQLAKRALFKGLDLPLSKALKEADRMYLEELMKSEDSVEGLRAFIEKRKPVWKGK